MSVIGNGADVDANVDVNVSLNVDVDAIDWNDATVDRCQNEIGEVGNFPNWKFLQTDEGSGFVQVPMKMIQMN